MIDYQDYREWLRKTGKDFGSIELLFRMNEYVLHRCIDEDSKGMDLAEIITAMHFGTIYRLRRCWQYTHPKGHSETLDSVLKLFFCYLNKSFDEYMQYDAERCLSENGKPNTLYLHQGNIACLRYKHPIESVAVAFAVNSEQPLLAHATRCKKCNIVFMQKEYYRQLRSQYPFLIGNFMEIERNGYSIASPGKLAAESPLKLCGYSVSSASDLTERERHEVLVNMIYNGILSKTEIIEYLEHFKKYNGSSLKNCLAYDKWKRDLDFIRKLNIGKHPVVKISEVKSYHHFKKKKELQH